MQAAVANSLAIRLWKRGMTQQAFGVLRALKECRPRRWSVVSSLLVARLGAECGALQEASEILDSTGGSIARSGKPQWLVEFTPWQPRGKMKGHTLTREKLGCGFSIYVWFSLFFIFICLCSFLRMIPIFYSVSILDDCPHSVGQFSAKLWDGDSDWIWYFLDICGLFSYTRNSWPFMPCCVAPLPEIPTPAWPPSNASPSRAHSGWRLRRGRKERWYRRWHDWPSPGGDWSKTLR